MFVFLLNLSLPLRPASAEPLAGSWPRGFWKKRFCRLEEMFYLCTPFRDMPRYGSCRGLFFPAHRATRARGAIWYQGRPGGAQRGPGGTEGLGRNDCTQARTRRAATPGGLDFFREGKPVLNLFLQRRV